MFIFFSILKTKQEIISYVTYTYCKKLGLLSEICSEALDIYGPYFLQILSRDIVSHI